MADDSARILPVSWQHMNRQSESDCCAEALTDALCFDLKTLPTVK